jgi:hypothetical protein
MSFLHETLHAPYKTQTSTLSKVFPFFKFLEHFGDFTVHPGARSKKKYAKVHLKNIFVVDIVKKSFAMFIFKIKNGRKN